MLQAMIYFASRFVRAILLLSLFLTSSLAFAQNADSHNDVMQNWDAVLAKYAAADNSAAGRANLFHYGVLASNLEDMAKLGAYIDAMAALEPSAMEPLEAMAYWGNLYNALTVQLVSQNWSVSSIKKIKSGLFSAGPWKRELITVEGVRLSLDNIEHDILRPEFRDPRIHYMVNCASIGCPNLALTPWQAKSLEADLDMAARAFVNSPRGVKVEHGKLEVSSIYHWFKEDFGDTDEGVIEHLKKHAAPQLAVQLEGLSKISRHDYDWSINSADKG